MDIRMKKRAKKELIKKREARQLLIKNLRELYHFVKWLNTKALPNRRARKDFWRRIANGETLIEKTITNLEKRFELHIQQINAALKPKKKVKEPEIKQPKPITLDKATFKKPKDSKLPDKIQVPERKKNE